MWIGNPAGSSEFALATGANAGTATEHGILFDINETKLVNPTIMAGTGSLQSAVSVTSNISNVQISDSNGKLPSNTSLPVTAISISAVGGGGGGKGSEGGGNGSNGGNTVYTLTGSYLGAATATIVSVTASGGAGATAQYAWYGEAGEDSTFAAGGSAANASFGNGGNGSQGSGGGGGGGRQPGTFTSSTAGGAGGSAGTNASDFVELTGYTNVRLTITLGSGGSGGAATRNGNGGAGGAGVANYQIQTSSLEQVYLSPNPPIGVNQTWQSFAIGSARSMNTYYTAPSDRAIMINIQTSGANAGIRVRQNSGATAVIISNNNAGGYGNFEKDNHSAIIPAGYQYEVFGSASFPVQVWAELR